MTRIITDSRRLILTFELLWQLKCMNQKVLVASHSGVLEKIFDMYLSVTRKESSFELFDKNE